MATALGMSIIYGPYSVFKPGGELFNSAQNVIYGSFSRLAWALALAWVVYACQHKMGGRLFYCFYFLCWFDLPGSEKYKYNNEAKTCDYYILCLSLSFLRDILVRVLLFIVQHYCMQKFQSQKLLLFPCHY